MTRLIYILLIAILPLSVFGQTENGSEASKDVPEEYVLSEEDIQQITEDITVYLNELNNLAVMISGAKKLSNINGLEASLQSINIRWNTYYSLEQKDISISEDLTQMLVQYQQLYKVVGDSIAHQKDIVNAENNFSAAEKFIKNSEGKYQTFLADATKWSLTSKTAKQLEEVKAQEQLLFQQIDKQYQAAQAAAALCPKLAQRMVDLENVYVSIKTDSETVQAAAYKPIILRVKDYVLSFAGVAIIILFFSMMQSKISAMKAAHKAAKEMKQQMMRSQSDIPEI